jgi:hypothetical protein
LRFETDEAQRIAFDNLNVATKFIDNNNELFRQGLRTYELAVYPFSLISDEVFGEKYLGLEPPSNFVRRKRETLTPEQCKDVPESLNWAEQNKVTAVKDQKKCGSCFIFSSTGAIESAIAIEYGITPINMSIQHSLDCIKDPKTGKQNGCTGGRPEWVWKATKENGGAVQQTGDNEYTGKPNEQCNEGATRSPYGDVDYWERITFKGTPEEVEEQIKCRLAKSGPFHVSMSVKKNDMGSFKSGVYKNSDGACNSSEPVNHGLLLVGYGEKLLQGDRKPTKYWVIQNSWGERWGEEGYLKVERGVNICNFATDAYFPVIKKKLSPIEKPAVCKDSQDMFDSSKKYSKSLCLVEDEKSYDEAQKFCISNGMRLFRDDTENLKESLFSYASKNWSDNLDFTPYVNGVTGDACRSIKKSGDLFEEDIETDCADKAPFICEFINNSPNK